MDWPARPIQFSPALVPLVLSGEKTQTRRLAVSAKGRPHPLLKAKPGDLLWVQERHLIECDVNGDAQPLPFDDGRPVKRVETFADGNGWCQAHYAASDPFPALAFRRTGEEVRHWRPAFLMPRWASRATLRVTDVSRQQLWALTEADALAEGIQPVFAGEGERYRVPGGDGDTRAFASNAFAALWNSLHRRPGTTWTDNPEVVAITFERIG